MTIIDPNLLSAIDKEQLYDSQNREQLYEMLKMFLLDLLKKNSFKIPVLSTVARELLMVIDDKTITFEKINLIKNLPRYNRNKADMEHILLIISGRAAATALNIPKDHPHSVQYRLWRVI